MKVKIAVMSFLFALSALVIAQPNLVLAADQIQTLNDDLDMRIDLLNRYNKKHADAIVNAAQDEVFKKYFAAKTDDEKKALKTQIEDMSLTVQEKFKVDEMCLIDATGRERMRCVFNKKAPDSDLSSDEGKSPFFKPGFEQNAKGVYMHEAYMSGDSKRWVTCYATPIVLEDGTKAAIYHYEMPLYFLQESINKDAGTTDDSYVLLVNKDGYVISDSHKKIALELVKAAGQTDDAAVDAATYDKYFPKLDAAIAAVVKLNTAGSGAFSAGGKDFVVAFKPANFHDWTMVEVSKK